MNIAINTLPFSTEHRMRGTGVYTKNLIDSLKKYEKGHSYSFFTRVQDIPKGTDVVHYPFFDPFFLTLPLAKQYPTAVTVHDMIPLVFPDKFPSGLRGSLKWKLQRASLRGASAVITDSACSQRDISRLTGKALSHIHVVPLAPSPKYNRVKSAGAITAVLRRYSIGERFVLYVGDVNWNKNVPGLLAAWKMLKAKKPDMKPYQLVLLGSAFTDIALTETRDILHRAESLGIAKSIVRPGYVKDEDMASVYSGSACVVLPSWYEGFGFPVLEAMACGAPVVATNKGSVPEISGPAFAADPGDPAAFARAIASLLSMPLAERREMVKRGLEWAKKFTWARVARETVSVYSLLV